MEILNPFSSILGIYANIESIRSDRQRRSLDLERENIESQKAALEREQESTAGYD